MRPTIRAVTTTLTALALAAGSTTLHAQSPIRLGLGAGVTMPVGDISETTSAGVNFQASLTYEPRKFPVGFEIDATYHNFAPKETSARNTHVMALTGGITIPISGTLGQPYLMAGVGYYNTQGPTTGPVDAERDIGGYGGVGIRFQTKKLEMHVRAGFHEIMAEKDHLGRTRSREMIPISFTLVL